MKLSFNTKIEILLLAYQYFIEKGYKIPPYLVLGKKKGMAKSIVKAVIDDLFAILADPSRSQEDKDAVNQKINELYTEFRRAAKNIPQKDK